MKIEHMAINVDSETVDGRMSSLKKELDKCQNAGFSAVELRLNGLGVVDNGELNERRIDAVERICREYPFQYLVHGPNPLNLMNLEQDDFEWNLFTASMEFANRMGSPIMVYHAGRFCPEERFMLREKRVIDEGERNRLWNYEKNRLRDLGSIAARRGVVIAVENAKPYLDQPFYCYGESLKELAIMIDEVNHPNVGATLDVGHAFLASNYYGYDLFGELTILAPYVRHVHLHDNFGRCCSSFERGQAELAVMGRGDLHMPPGWGSVPFSPILKCLSEYQGTVTVELVSRYREDLAEVYHGTRSFFGRQELCA